MAERLNLAMWSGPRNLSTALMRSFANREDIIEVIDEPFYASYLKESKKKHPNMEITGKKSISKLILYI